MEEEGRALSFLRGMEEHGDIAAGMEAADHGGAARALDAQVVGADGDALVGADFGFASAGPKRKGPPGQWGAGRRTERFSLRARFQRKTSESVKL